MKNDSQRNCKNWKPGDLCIKDGVQCLVVGWHPHHPVIVLDTDDGFITAASSEISKVESPEPEENILPCPFCGKTAQISTGHDSNGDAYYLVECDGCTAEGPASDCWLQYTGIVDDKEERKSAIDKWNRRYLAGSESELSEVIRQAYVIGLKDRETGRPLGIPGALKRQVHRIKMDISSQISTGLLRPFDYKKHDELIGRTHLVSNILAATELFNTRIKPQDSKDDE